MVALQRQEQAEAAQQRAAEAEQIQLTAEAQQLAVRIDVTATEDSLPGKQGRP